MPVMEVVGLSGSQGLEFICWDYEITTIDWRTVTVSIFSLLRFMTQKMPRLDKGLKQMEISSRKSMGGMELRRGLMGSWEVFVCLTQGL